MEKPNNQLISQLSPFWSPGRKVFVPLLPIEFARRARIDEGEAGKRIRDAVREGYVVTSRNEAYTVYQLTSVGKNLFTEWLLSESMK